MINRIIVSIGLLLINASAISQDFVQESFASTRVINNHSNEMLPARSLEFIVAHKFGDMYRLGSDGKIKPNSAEWFGFDNLADVRIAFEYGIFNNLNVGLGRSKGVGSMTQMVDSYAKYRILQQKSSGMPISLTYVSTLALSYRAKSADSTLINSWPTFAHRFRFVNQILVTRKFSDRFTLQMNLGYHHRNYVMAGDKNGITFGGVSGRFRFTKTIGLLWEYNYQFNRPSSITASQNHLAFGIEILTGGHAFALTISNSESVNENLFITETTSNWLDGGFRFGFSINRRFKL